MLIQRVSEESSCSRPQTDTSTSLGLLHVRFSKNKTPISAPPMFYCPCTIFKRFSSTQSIGAPTPRISKSVCTFTSASGLLLPTRSSLRSILASASLNRLKQDLKIRFLLYTDALTHTHTHNITHTSVYLSELSMDIEIVSTISTQIH